MSHTEKGSILWLIFSSKSLQSKKIQLFESYSRKKVQFSASCSRKKGSILCVIFKNKRFNSLRHMYSRTKGSILCVILKKKRFNSSSRIEKWVQFFESYQEEFNFLSHFWKKGVQFFESYFFKKKKVQFFESCSTKGFNSVSPYSLKINSLSHISKGSILWVMFKRFNSWSFFWSSNFWVVFKKKSVRFFESY